MPSDPNNNLASVDTRAAAKASIIEKRDSLIANRLHQARLSSSPLLQPVGNHDLGVPYQNIIERINTQNGYHIKKSTPNYNKEVINAFLGDLYEGKWNELRSLKSIEEIKENLKKTLSLRGYNIKDEDLLRYMIKKILDLFYYHPVKWQGLFRKTSAYYELPDQLPLLHDDTLPTGVNPYHCGPDMIIHADETGGHYFAFSQWFYHLISDDNRRVAFSEKNGNLQALTLFLQKFTATYQTVLIENGILLTGDPKTISLDSLAYFLKKLPPSGERDEKCAPIWQEVTVALAKDAANLAEALQNDYIYDHIETALILYIWSQTLPFNDSEQGNNYSAMIAELTSTLSASHPILAPPFEQAPSFFSKIYNKIPPNLRKNIGAIQEAYAEEYKNFMRSREYQSAKIVIQKYLPATAQRDQNSFGVEFLARKLNIATEIYDSANLITPINTDAYTPPALSQELVMQLVETDSSCQAVLSTMDAATELTAAYHYPELWEKTEESASDNDDIPSITSDPISSDESSSPSPSPRRTPRPRWIPNKGPLHFFKKDDEKQIEAPELLVDPSGWFNLDPPLIQTPFENLQTYIKKRNRVGEYVRKVAGQDRSYTGQLKEHADSRDYYEFKYTQEENGLSVLVAPPQPSEDNAKFRASLKTRLLESIEITIAAITGHPGLAAAKRQRADLSTIEFAVRARAHDLEKALLIDLATEHGLWLVDAENNILVDPTDNSDSDSDSVDSDSDTARLSSSWPQSCTS